MGTLGGSPKYPRLNLLKDVVRDGAEGLARLAVRPACS